MKTGRLEAFSDGVIAVIITIMVLELKVPHTGDPSALLAVAPSLIVYALSFLVVAILWVNHHHLIEKARHAGPALLWSNNSLLFSMSLIPFVTAYLGENHGAPLAAAAYGAVMTAVSCTYLLLQLTLAAQAPDDPIRKAEFSRLNRKAATAVLFYAISVVSAFRSIWISFAVFLVFPALYFWPQRKPSND